MGVSKQVSHTPTPTDVVTQKRRDRVRELLLSGEVCLNKIALGLGVSFATAQDDVDYVYMQFQRESRLKPSEALAEAINRFSSAAQKNLASYERSRQDAEEITTTYTPKPCYDCGGSGFKEGTEDWCDTCQGTGKIQVENVTRKIKGQAGDASFMAEYRKCIEMIARLKGCFAKFENVVPPLPPSNNTVIFNNTAKLDVKGMSPDVLLDSMKLLAKLQPLVIQSGMEEENNIIEVEVVK